MVDLPLGLRHILEFGEGVLFVGAGIGCHFFRSDGSPAPDGTTLAKELADNFSIETNGNYNLPVVSEIVQLRKGRKELENFVRSRLTDLKPDETFQWISKIKWKAIFTTNYDYCIQRAYELNPNPPQILVPCSLTSEIRDYDRMFEVPLYYLHGTLFGPSKPQIIITESDYAVYKEYRKSLFDILKLEFATSSILYIGYSNRDPNWKTLIEEMSREFYPSKFLHSYRISPADDLLENEILRSKDIETITCTFSDFVDSASATIPDIISDRDKLLRIRDTIPSELTSEFDTNPAAISRLLVSWDYVNQAPFHEKPNIYNFLRGDRPNWGLIGSNQHFERDIEEQIYEELLDYATGKSNKPSINIVLAPAGYGITTLQMSLASRLVKDRVGPVFSLRPGCTLLEGDVDFASKIFSTRPFFFIDKAADHSTKIHSIMHLLSDLKRPAMLVVGSRLNEWRQEHGKVRGREFEIEALSDPEINRLLDCLGMHSELKNLEHLSRDIQFSVIKGSYNKELLVAMREATEGKSFDAILEDEFNGIKDNISKQLYLNVCCFFQHGAYVRDQLLSDLMGMPLTDMFSSTKDATDGVIIYDCLNPSAGNYVARARHRTIAKVVWERCSTSSEKETVLQKSLAFLNLNYRSDKDAFEHFIRSDHLIDSIGTLEGKIRFFDKACQKDPDSPYVRQHYSRMLSREGKTELALSQIDQAINLNNDVRILHHTKGTILSQMALDRDTVLDIARRRLVQSESAYRNCLRMHEKDDYSYVGLAQLYLGWAKRASTEEETTTYISKSEEIINEGLKKARVRDSLYIESSKIQGFLGDQPSYIKSLEKAVRESPLGVIARYLLGRAYRKSGDPQKALDVLDFVIKNYHEEFRSFVEYSLSMIYLGKPYNEAISILRLSTLYGYSDPRFIATLGGLLFLNEQFSEADKVFNESSRHNFTAKEVNTIQFCSPNPNNLNGCIHIKGKVAIVGAGYALIDSDKYPRIICPGSKFREVRMSKGLDLTFELTFSAKGPVADKPVPV